MGAQLESSLAEAVGTPCLGISALGGQGTEHVMPTVLRAYDTWNQRGPTARLNRWLVQVGGLLVLYCGCAPADESCASADESCNSLRAHPVLARAQLIEDYKETAQGRQVLRLRYVTQASAPSAPCTIACVTLQHLQTGGHFSQQLKGWLMMRESCWPQPLCSMHPREKGELACGRWLIGRPPLRHSLPAWPTWRRTPPSSC